MSRLEEADERWVCTLLGVQALEGTQVIQRLWGGYGALLRVRLPEERTVIVKRVQWPSARQHPRGWATDRSHDRKVRSYAVEVAWYREYADRCDAGCRVPRCLGERATDDGVLLVLEDLDAAGFPHRDGDRPGDLRGCLTWLARFHARFLGQTPAGLWPEGTYWHLDTRPDEWAALPEGPLKEAAETLAARLREAPFQTFVHGDAKLANFCFGAPGAVAAVDFQYVGGGCGMKDVAYFISSCVSERDADRVVPGLLDHYFARLREALPKDVDPDALEDTWRALYPVAWTDFYRFLQGWSPRHPKIHRYSERLAGEVLRTMTA